VWIPRSSQDGSYMCIAGGNGDELLLPIARRLRESPNKASAESSGSED